MPLKEEAWELAETRDVSAERTHCANTLIRQGDGWHAANTDVEGLVKAVRQELQSVPSNARIAGMTSAVIIGSGATARSATAAASSLGVESLQVYARNRGAAQSVLDVARSYGIPQVAAGPITDIAQGIRDADLVVSTLPGSAAHDVLESLVEDSSTAARSGILLDVAYDPWPSALAQAWYPYPVVSGLDMLLWQAVAQVVLMTGEQPSVDAMRAAVYEGR